MNGMRFILPVLLLILTTAFVPADNPNAIVGTWLNGSKKGHVQIYEKEGRYYGKLVWLSVPNDPETGKPKLDAKNEDPSRRSRPLMNLPLMYNLKFRSGNVWDDGKIYNPEDGKEYNLKMTLKDPNTLDVRGYLGISLLGKTQTWVRVK